MNWHQTGLQWLSIFNLFQHIKEFWMTQTHYRNWHHCAKFYSFPSNVQEILLMFWFHVAYFPALTTHIPYHSLLGNIYDHHNTSNPDILGSEGAVSKYNVSMMKSLVLKISSCPQLHPGLLSPGSNLVELRWISLGSCKAEVFHQTFGWE